MKKISSVIGAMLSACMHITAMQLPLNMGHDYHFEIPLIGVYSAEYQFAAVEANITSPAIIDVLPDSLVDALAPKLGYQGPADLAVKRHYLHEKLNTDQLHASIAFYAQLPPTSKGYNIVFHRLVGQYWLKHDKFFQRFIDVGMFENRGVAPVDLAVNEFKAVDVNYHPPRDYSPDNARFTIEPNRALASFWIAGVAPDLNKAAVTYVVLAVTPPAVDFFNSLFAGMDLRRNVAVPVPTKVHTIIKRLHNFIGLLPAVDHEVAQNVSHMLHHSLGRCLR